MSVGGGRWNREEGVLVNGGWVGRESGWDKESWGKREAVVS